MVENPLTPYPEVNALVGELYTAARAILGSHFVGMYLYGSLATGDFDRYSDIDFLVVTDVAVAAEFFYALQEMHALLARGDSWWATDVEGCYIPLTALRRYDPSNARHPHLERGRDRQLVIETLGVDWVLQRRILRERGLVVTGPPLQMLIDPISYDDVLQAAHQVLHDRMVGHLSDPVPLHNRGYQSYVVLTLCRVLYTLATGEIVSKRAAAEWAKMKLDARWTPLIERAWVGRQNSGENASPDDIAETLEFLCDALQHN